MNIKAGIWKIRYKINLFIL